MWRYVLKTVLAAFIAIAVAMVLDLPQPKTAMTTVFIVMQPQSGMVLAKSFYRIVGTLVGLVVMLVLISLFSQYPELFVLGIVSWMGVCTAGALRYRHLRSYGFLLAGYTPALIGFAAAQDPNTAFIASTTRVLEILLGVVVSAIVSATVFPEHSELAARKVLDNRFRALVSWVADLGQGRVDPSRLEALSVQWAADVVRFEGARNAAWFEGASARMRGTRLAHINAEFMEVTTRLHALSQLLIRLDAASRARVADPLHALMQALSVVLSPDGAAVGNAYQANALAARLGQFGVDLPSQLDAARRMIEPAPADVLLEFDTGGELLSSLVVDLRAYADTYASLHDDKAQGSGRHTLVFRPHTNAFAAGVAGGRAMLVVLLLAAVWIATAWPDGMMAVLTAGPVCALASTTPNALMTARQMTLGALFACLVAIFLSFVVYPAISSLALLYLALAPFLIAGVYLTTQIKTLGIGLGFCIFVSFLAGPDNYARAAAMPLVNDCVSLMIAFIVVTLAYTFVWPTSGNWLRSRLLRQLRRRVLIVCTQRRYRDSRILRAHFESGTRDLMSQLMVLPEQSPAQRKAALAWAFVVLEVGHALLDLRVERMPPPDPATMPRPESLSLDAMVSEIARFFERSDRAHYDKALASVAASIERHGMALSQATNADSDGTSVRSLRRTLSRLHFIRTALIDAAGPRGIWHPAFFEQSE
ncbi:FUSC family protein [Robbsia sp. KACC 23696]|uniref:FUSC family protein n=1 Tax=Robbsia sp. KACC 23696 TaxID=3149231 RepID=UPI00325B1BDA